MKISVHVFLFSVVWNLLLIFQSSFASPTDSASRLIYATWEGSAFSHSRQGVCCWIEGNEGEIRLDFSQVGSMAPVVEELSNLLSWKGIGWTLILGSSGEGTLNQWGQRWSKLNPELEVLIRGLFEDLPVVLNESSTTLLDGILWGFRPGKMTDALLPGQNHHFRIQREILSVRQNQRATDVSEAGTGNFRDHMVSRGLGRGGVSEMLTVEFFVPGALDDPGAIWIPGTKLLISSSRRSGRLELGVLSVVSARHFPPELFLPLWPLETTISTDGDIKGTILNQIGLE